SAACGNRQSATVCCASAVPCSAAAVRCRNPITHKTDLHLRMRMPMKRIALLLAAAVALVIPVAATAQDVITVGSATASSNTVDIPVSVRDVGGTPLGVDQPAGSKIQSFSIKVNYSPASAISGATFTRAGITASLSPTFESSPSGSGSISWLATFAEGSANVPFTLNKAAPGDLAADIVFTLSGTA